MHWSPIQGAEHLAMRDNVGLMDLSSLAIIELEGKDACDFANYVCTNKMDIDVGKVTYTLWCTPKGGVKRDVAVSRLSKDRYWIFTGNGTLPQEIDWLESFKGEYDVRINDLSTSSVALGLFGPQARAVLEQVTPNDVSNEAFPFYTWQHIEIGMATVYAMRISYVGELGWEFHMSPDVAATVYDELYNAGLFEGMVPVGVGAMRSMRVEKGYRLWGGDVYTEHNPYEAGMGWMVKLKKGDFVGRDALVKAKAEPLTRKLVTILIDDPEAVVTGNEPVFVGNDCIGQITSGNYGYSVGKYVAFAYVPVEHAVVGTAVEVEYLAERFSAVISNDVPFDPKNEKMKA